MQPEQWHRVEDLYHRALELDEGSRTQFLEQACGHDRALRREVESLLAHLKSTEHFIESSALEIGGKLTANEQRRREPQDSDLVGATVSHFRILGRLGAGGMGVVYKARDLHLDRFVAIKVLPPGRIADPERKRRFIFEAHAASTLNHPNIITVHDVVSDDNLDFIVMEFVLGRSIDHLIGRKGLKLAEVLKYGTQIADAVAAAHAAGIIHRDLKPGNIMVTDNGLIKVLDFGLAKLAPVGRGPLAVTQTGKHTEEGMIVGTVAYMSPEQAEGKNVDARSDIFSFGIVLYEMITGEQPFQGDTKLAILSAVIEKDPKPVSMLSGEAPLELEKLVSRCLRKDPERRLQHMGDIKLALTELKEESESNQLRATTPIRAPAPGWWIVTPIFLMLVVAIIVALWMRRENKPPSRSEWVQVTNLPDSVSQPALSPDGHMLTFVRGTSTFAATGQIYVKILPDGEPVQLTRDDLQKMSPVFSPDSSKIAYTAVPSETHWDTWLVPVLGVRPP